MTHSKHFEKVEASCDRRFSMNKKPSLKILTLSIAAALAQMASFSAMADTAVGVDTVIGNAGNPGYSANGPVERDADAAPPKRTPTGQLYFYPPVTAAVEGKSQLVGSIDAGVVYDSDATKNAKRNEYTPSQSGVNVNNFKLSADGDAASYFTVNGGGVGRSDQFYDITVGKYNGWKVKGFYNETQHVFTDTWKSLYSGEGTGTLNHGLPMPQMVKAGTFTPGTGFAGVAGCSAAAPCWSYNGTVYGNAVAVAAVNGTTGTPVQLAGGTAAQNTGAITAVNGATASGATQSNIAAAIYAKLAATPYSELGLIRKKGGARGDITLSDNLKAYASFSLEKRVGARPLAMNDNNTSTEIAEAIDYKTYETLLGLSYKDELNQANLRFSSSLFRNNVSTMDVQFLLLNNAGPMGAMQHGTFDLAPDNEAYNIKGEFVRDLPSLLKGRFTAAASYGVNKQDDALLAPISAAQSADLAAANGGSLTNVTIPGANAGYAANSALVTTWNTTNALSQKTAKQEIDNKLIDLGLSVKPVNDLSVKAGYRYYETINKGGYTAYNPLTGQFGRGPAGGQAVTTLELLVAPVMNAAGQPTAACYAPSGQTIVAGCSTTLAALANGNNVPVYGQARSTKQTNLTLTADYDLTRTSSINATVEQEDFHRTFREREKTTENKFKLGYVNREIGNASLRASYETDTKRGGEYRYRTFEDLGTGIPGLDIATQLALENPNNMYVNAAGVVILAPANVTNNGVTYPALAANLFTRYSTLMRKYDQADRDQNILNGRVNYAVREDLDMGVNLQMKRATYPNSFYGLTSDNQDSVGFDLNFQPSASKSITAFYNYQNGNKKMSLNSGIAGGTIAGTTFTAASCVTLGSTFSAYSCADAVARPASAAWQSDTTDRNDVIGAGFQNDFGFVRLGIDYTFAKSSTHISYTTGSYAYALPSASTTGTLGGNNAAMAALAGSALPDMTTVQQTITINLVKPIDKKASVRAMYRYDNMRIADWHYDGVIHNVMAAYDAGTLLLDSGPSNYHVSTVGISLNYKL
jgi:hypothetical protein